MDNIVLTGFMGTGKSSVGRELARRLGRRFVDMDDRIVAHFGRPIPEVFASHGEARFREVEAQICRELAGETELVIATGGGALVDARNRQVMAAGGTVICLTATAQTILQRVAADENRPLLAGSLAQREARITELLTRRRSAYDAIPLQVATDGLQPAQVVDRILALLSRQRPQPSGV